jgi:hypothetical protein
MVDRHEEMVALHSLLESRPALIVLRGRRRVGKSFLLATAFAHERILTYQADEQPERGQLALFAQEAARLLPGEPPLTFATWDEALRFVGTQASTQPLCLVLDEFQLLCQNQPALPSILQRHWDQWQRDDIPILVAISGSALSFMGGLLDHDSPLYGRASYRPLLEPLDYRWSAEFTERTSAEHVLRRYAILGGTPQYHLWAGDLPLKQFVSERILTRGRPLYDEPLHLLRQGEGVRTPGTYLSVLWAIARGDTKHSQIKNRTGLGPTPLTYTLDRLQEFGYIERRSPADPKTSSSRGYYRIPDPYFRFWFRYVFPNRSRLELGRVDDVADEIFTDMDNHMGTVYEDCCRLWLARYAPSDLSGSFDELGSWWTRDGQTEIDIAAYRGNRYTLLGSVKWRRTIDLRVLDELEHARDQLGARAARARLVLFARTAFTDRLRARAEREDVTLITAANLFGS